MHNISNEFLNVMHMKCSLAQKEYDHAQRQYKSEGATKDSRCNGRHFFENGFGMPIEIFHDDVLKRKKKKRKRHNYLPRYFNVHVWIVNSIK